MLVYIIRRWDDKNPNNQITNRFDIKDYELVIDYTSNSTSKFKIQAEHEIRSEIKASDFIYVPDFKWIGLIKEYDKSSHEIVAGDILNAYQFPYYVDPITKFADIAGWIVNQLEQSKTKFPELKMDMFNWTNTTTTRAVVTMDYNNGGIEKFRDIAQDLLLRGRITDTTRDLGFRIYVDNIDNTSTAPKGLQINMAIGVTSQPSTTKFVYSEDKGRRRVVENLEIKDKQLTQTSVILYNEDGTEKGQYWLDQNYGSVIPNRPSTSMYPIYVGGYVIKETTSTDEIPPTDLQIAASQLPVNQANNFTFTISKTQGFIGLKDILPGTVISVSIVKGTDVERVLKGAISTLSVNESEYKVTVGQDRPKLVLTI